jgi:hypothetical protein
MISFYTQMKRAFQFFAVVFVLLIAYAAWPLFGLKTIVDAVQSRDVVSLSERIDTAALKKSLVAQIALAYLRVTGKQNGLSPLETRLAIVAATAMAGPQVDAMLQPERLMELLTQGRTDRLGEAAQLGVPELQAPNLHNLYRLIRNTQYSGMTFSVVLPLTADEDSGYRLQLKLEDWTWKLSGIALPPDIQTKIATEIIHKSRRGT